MKNENERWIKDKTKNQLFSSLIIRFLFLFFIIPFFWASISFFHFFMCSLFFSLFFLFFYYNNSNICCNMWIIFYFLLAAPLMLNFRASIYLSGMSHIGAFIRFVVRRNIEKIKIKPTRVVTITKYWKK